MTMTLISAVTVTGSTTWLINFTAIPQDGTDLLLLGSLRLVDGTSFTVGVNGNETLSGIEARASGATNDFASEATSLVRPAVNASTTTANGFSNMRVDVLNYTTSRAKEVSYESVNESNTTSSGFAWIRLGGARTANTAAVTSLALTASGAGTFVPGSTAYLYKITKGSDGITTVS